MKHEQGTIVRPNDIKTKRIYLKDKLDLFVYNVNCKPYLPKQETL